MPTFTFAISLWTVLSAPLGSRHRSAAQLNSDHAAAVRGLTIAVSIISVFLAMVLAVCIYLVKKLRDQETRYEERLASMEGYRTASRMGSSLGYQAHYVDGRSARDDDGDGDHVPLVMREQDIAPSRQSSVSSASLYSRQ